MRTARFVKRFLLPLVCPHAANAGTKNDANTRFIHRILGPSCVLYRHIGSSDAELREEVHPIDRLSIDKIERIEPLHFAGKFRIVIGCIEARDRRGARAPAHEAFPITGKVEPERRDRAHSGNDDSSASCLRHRWNYFFPLI